MGDTISLIPTCGFLFTMNPGYASRTELPETLKAFFFFFFLLLRHDLSRFFRRANRTPVNRAFRSSKVVDNISVYWWPRARRYSLLNEIVTKHLINFNVTFVVNIMRKRTISFAIHKPIVRERTSYSLAVHA
jgi:hypothetical protein